MDEKGDAWDGFDDAEMNAEEEARIVVELRQAIEAEWLDEVTP